MAQRNRGKPQMLRRARDTLQSEGRAPRVGAIEPHRNLVGQARDLLQQGAHLRRVLAIVQRGDKGEWLRDALQVGLELGKQGVVEHGVLLRGASGVRAGIGHCFARQIAVRSAPIQKAAA